MDCSHSDPTPPPSAASSKATAAKGVDRARRFVAEFTDGLDRGSVKRLFDQDATQAFRALTGPRDDRRLPKGALGRLAVDVRDVFLGFVFKLSPARRMLFVVSLLLPLLGMARFEAQIGPTLVSLDFSPLWFDLGMAGLTLLLALELVDRQRVRDELEVARALQRDLLPERLPLITDLAIAHSYRTANEIGGDYYGFHPLDDGRVAIAVGDASGHGMAAGLLMAIANAALGAAIDLDPEPASVLDAVNRTLVRTGGKRAFMTLFYGVLDPASGVLRFANAGHPFPLLRCDQGLVELGEGALPLGLWPDYRATPCDVLLAPGDLLLLYSDGIPESVSAGGEDFGFERLEKLAASPGTAQQVHDRVVASLDAHLGEETLRDDMTLVVLERLPPRPSLGM